MIDTGMLVFGLVLFLAVVLGLEGLFIWWNSTRSPEARRMEQRLRALAQGGPGESVSLLKRRVLADSPGLVRLLQRLPFTADLDRLLLQSGLSMNVGDLLIRCLLFGLGGVVLSIVLRVQFLFVVPIVAAAGSLPLLYAVQARQKRLKTFDTSLAECIDLMARALRAGHAFPTALQMVGDEMSGPCGSEFRLTFDEINFGVTIGDALLNLLQRVPSDDLKYFVVAIVIQRETGGNLAEVLDNIAAIVRARIKLMGQVRTLSAEGRLSAIILTLLPFGTAALIYVLTPDFLTVLFTDPIGPKLITAALVMMGLGIFWLSKIVRIRV